MPFKVFIVPIHGAEQAESELNGFLRSHQIVGVEKRWVEQGSTSFWCFCVDFLDAARRSASSLHEGTPALSDRPESLIRRDRLDEVGQPFVIGAVLYLGNKVLPFGDRLIGLPLCHLWLPG